MSTTEAPKFEPDSPSAWYRHSSALHQSDPAPSLFVRAEGVAVVAVNAVTGGCSSRFNLTPAVARALAAELIAAADAAEPQEQAA